METFPWGFVIVGGPVILGLAIAWGYFRSAKRDAKIDPNTPADDPSRGMPGHDRASDVSGSPTVGGPIAHEARPPVSELLMTDKSREQQAEDALPEGVARGRSLNTPSEELQLRAGGIGPGGQIGPDPNTPRLQEGSTFSLEPEGDLPQGPLSADPRTPVPTSAKDDDVDDLNQS